MPLDTTIRDTVKKFVDDEKMFTSVDIATDIKKRGIWVRTVEVRAWLQRNFDKDSLMGDYNSSQIGVCNNTTLATLYHPIWQDPNEYQDRDQQPLTPIDVKNIQLTLKNQLRPDTAPDINDVFDAAQTPDSDGSDDNKDDNDDEGYTITSVERLKIPGALIRKLGWKPGDTIDPALIQTSRTIPATLKVNKDYRVSIPRNSVDWGTSPVKLKVKGGRIVFEKA